MRRIPFSEIINNGPINIEREYKRLFFMFCEDKVLGEDKECSMKNLCGINFNRFPIRGTCISLNDYDNTYNFHFEKEPQNLDINYLISFCEYSYNLAVCSRCFNDYTCFTEIDERFHMYIQQVNKVIDIIGYMAINHDGITDFVPKDAGAISVSELMDENFSYKILEYNHHSMRGDIDRKREILFAFANKLEAEKTKLRQINATLDDDLCYLFNNMNIRHNNVNGEKTNKKYSVMTDDEIEQWYDDIYQMCLLAFLELEHKERKERIKEFKINKKVEEN